MGSDRQGLSFDTDEGAPRWPTSSEGARSSSSTTSCSGPTTRRAARPARASPTGSTASPSTSRTTTSMLTAVSRAPLAKLQAFKQRMGWTFPWASSHEQRLQRDFNVRFTEEQQREGGIEYNYRREGQLAARCGSDTPVGADRGHDRNRRGDVHARAAGRERVRARGRRRLPHLLRRMRAAWTACGACTSGSTARRWAATSRASWWRHHDRYEQRAERSHHGRDADARRLDDVDDVDADARTDVAGRRSVVPRHVDRDDGGDDAAIARPDADALSASRSTGGATRASVRSPPSSASATSLSGRCSERSFFRSALRSPPSRRDSRH